MKNLIISICLALFATTGCAHFGGKPDDKSWVKIKADEPQNSGQAAVGPSGCQGQSCPPRLVLMQNPNDYPALLVVQTSETDAKYNITPIGPKQNMIVKVGDNGGFYRLRRTDPAAAGQVKPPVIKEYLSKVEDISKSSGAVFLSAD